MDMPVTDLYTDNDELVLAASAGVRARELIEAVDDKVDAITALTSDDIDAIIEEESE